MKAASPVRRGGVGKGLPYGQHLAGFLPYYECLPEGSVVCRLRLRIGEEWITKMDVGGQSEQPDEGDRRKAAFSDALKRAAVKFGIGRYLYRLPQVWADYDPKKRQFVRTPTLPATALPPAPARTGPQEAPARKEARPAASAAASKPAKPTRTSPAAEPAAKSGASKGAPALPANGLELQRRLYDYDARLAKQGLCEAGELVKHVVQAGQKAGYEADLAAWSGPAIQLAVEETKAFEAQQRQQKKDKAELQEAAA